VPIKTAVSRLSTSGDIYLEILYAEDVVTVKAHVYAEEGAGSDHTFLFNTDELKALAYIFHTAHQRLTGKEAL